MKKITATFAIAAVAALSLTGCQNAVKNDPVTCTVTDKDRSTAKGGESVFRIYAEGEGCDDTYGLADNWLAGNFNASDMYAKTKVGKTYRFESVGVRNGFFSSFKEITKMTEVTK
jgi:hypothetical protein